MIMLIVDKLISFIVQQAPRTITGDRVLVVERRTSSLSLKPLLVRKLP